MENGTEVLTLVQGLVGMRYAESVKPYILEITGLDIAVGPNDISTRDIRTDRIFIGVDDTGAISKLWLR